MLGHLPIGLEGTAADGAVKLYIIYTIIYYIYYIYIYILIVYCILKGSIKASALLVVCIFQHPSPFKIKAVMLVEM